MTEDENEHIRALLREAHRQDEPYPPFDELVREPTSRRRPTAIAWALRSAVLLAIVALAMLVARRDRPPAPLPPNSVALSTGVPEGPLDFLLEVPPPAPLEALPSLRALPQTNRR